MDFKSFAVAYDHFSRDNEYNELYERPAIRAMLPNDLSGLSVVDAGCAGGLHAKWLIEHGAQVVAVDNDLEMVAIARRRLGDAARIVYADLQEPLTFLEDNSANLVFSSLTMHYLADWGPTLKEFRRILDRDGRLLFSTHHPCADREWGGNNYFATERLTQLWSEFGDKPYEVSFYRRPLSAIVRALDQAGFRIDKIVEPLPRPEMQQKSPETFDKLSRNPWFIIFEAVVV